MEEIDHKKTRSLGRPSNYFNWVATLLLVFPVFGMLYVSIAIFYVPIQIDAVIFVTLPVSPLFVQIEWYVATLIGLYAIFSVRKSNLPGLTATILLALAYVHLHLVLLGNISIPAWLTVLAAVSALIGAFVEIRRTEKNSCPKNKSRQTAPGYPRFWLPRQLLLHCSTTSPPCDYASLYLLRPCSRLLT
jgi:hypothetical protein